ncbi:MAG: MauE/DoxX family redox-associated membrane protein [Marinoscillum sp.]
MKRWRHIQSSKEQVGQVVAGLLVLLFVYTAVSKLIDWEAFKYQMSSQPLPSFLSDLLIWVLPTVELAAAGCLMVKSMRMIGMVLSFMLMLCFTVYVGLAVSGVFGEVPCSCGGVLQSLGWGEHLAFNLVFLAIAGVGWWSVVRVDSR